MCPCVPNKKSFFIIQIISGKPLQHCPTFPFEFYKSIEFFCVQNLYIALIIFLPPPLGRDQIKQFLRIGCWEICNQSPECFFSAHSSDLQNANIKLQIESNLHILTNLLKFQCAGFNLQLYYSKYETFKKINFRMCDSLANGKVYQ